jgi:hypothetical protein
MRIHDLKIQDLEPLAEVERALLMVQVLQPPGPELGSLLSLGNSEHCCGSKEISIKFLPKFVQELRRRCLQYRYSYGRMKTAR